MPLGSGSRAGGCVERETLVVSGHLNQPLCHQAKLLVEVVLRFGDGVEQGILALVDTGAEINLLRRGLVSDKYFEKSLKPKRFVTANKEVMDGGLVDMGCVVLIPGVYVDTGVHGVVELPAVFYDAHIGVDALLSYEWLQRSDIEVKCRKHGLWVNHPREPLWVPVVVERKRGGGQPRGVHGVQVNYP